MINDISAMILSDLSYINFGNEYIGYNLMYLINDEEFNYKHEYDNAFQSFLKNYEIFSDKYDPILSNYTLVFTEHYDSNYNGIALLNNQTNEIVIASKGTASAGDVTVTDKEMILGNTIPQYFLDAKDFTNKVKDKINKNNDSNIDYSSVNHITFTGHSLGGSVADYLRIINEGEGRFSYDAKALEPYGIKRWTTLPTSRYDEFNRITFFDEQLDIFQKKYTQLNNTGNFNIENLVNTHDSWITLTGDQIGMIRYYTDNGQNLDELSKEKMDAIDGISNFFYHKLSTYLLYTLRNDGNFTDQLNLDTIKKIYNVELSYKLEEESPLPKPEDFIKPPLPDMSGYGGIVHYGTPDRDDYPQDYADYVNECHNNNKVPIPLNEYYSGNDTIYFGGGDDTVLGYGGNDALYGGEGNDNFDAYGTTETGSDYYNGGAGNDWMRANGNDYLDGETGNDELVGSSNNNYFVGGVGNDIVTVYLGDNNYIDGGEDDDRIEVKGDNNYMLGGEGNDRIYSYGKNDYIDGGDGNDQLMVYKNSYIAGGKGDDGLSANSHSRIDGGEGNDTIDVGSYNEVNGGEGDDTISTTSTAVYNHINGDEGNDQIRTDGDNNYLDGGSGNDVLIVNQNRKNNYLNGGEGNDQLISSGENNYLDGGEGDDIIVTNNLYEKSEGEVYAGGEGNDVYIITGNPYGNKNTIFDINDISSKGKSCDKVKFCNMSPSDIAGVSREEYDLVIFLKNKYGDEADKGSIRFVDWFYGDDINSQYNCKIETFEFVQITANELYDAISGIKQPSQLEGTVTAVFSSTQIEDMLPEYGSTAGDIINGNENRNFLYAMSGDDLINGGKGDDYLAGGEGSDTYVYRRGDGNDTVFDENNIQSDGKSYDKLILEEITPADVARITRTNNNFTIILKASDALPEEKITISNWFSSNNDSDFKLEEIEFADGTKWNPAEMENNLPFEGTDNDDILEGSDNDDKIYGLGGTDDINGKGGDDTIYGGEGDDYISGGTGNNVLIGGEGNDVYIYDPQTGGNDVIIADKYDNLEIYLVPENEIVKERLSDSNDLVLKIVNQGVVKGSITLKDYYLSDENKIQNITFYPDDNGDETIVWEKEQIESNVVIIEPVIRGTSGDDALNGTDRDDTMEGGKGNDILSGGAGIDTYIYSKGDGSDIITDGTADKLELKDISSGEVNFIRKNGDLVIAFKDRSDTSEITLQNWFASGFKLSEISFADGSKWSVSDIEAKLLKPVYGTDKNDSITGTAADEIIYAKAGDDRIYGKDGNDTVYAGDGNDKVYGGIGDDTLHGEDGDDYLYGEAGNDTLIGGKGNDYLTGGDGNNTYVYRKGDGNDIIEDRNYSADKSNWPYDKLKLEGILPTDIESVSRTGYDFIIKFVDGGSQLVDSGSITFKNWFYGDVANGSYNFKTEEIEFEDGTKWSSSDIQKNLTVYGTDNSDSIVDTSEGNTIYAKAGDDRIYGKDGNDTIYAGGGNDKVYGGTGDDTLYGEAGDDYLYGEADNDTLIGGKGNDYLTGGEGNNIYIFNKGDGNDIVYGLNDITTTGVKTIDTIRFAGFVREDIQDKIKEGNDLIIQLKNEGLTDSIRVKNYFASTEVVDSNQQVVGGKNYKIENFEFDDVVLSSAEIESALNSYGTDGNDSITGTAGNNTIYGRKGDDTLRGLAGKDIIYGEEDNDKIYGGDGDDELSGGAGDDKLYGEGGNDLLDGGTGSDYMSGGEGNNTYVYRKGDGSDIIEDRNYSADKSSWSYDKLKLEGILPTDIESVSRTGYDFVIKFVDGGSQSADSGSITFKNWFYGDVANGSYNFKTEEIEFADGTKWSSSDIQKNLTVYGTDNNDSIVDTSEGNTIYAKAGDDRVYGKDGNDTVYAGDGNDKVYGGTGDDTLHGEAGNDYLYGEASNDTLIGGKGNDYLAGGEGNNTYVYRKGDGSDTIIDINDITNNGASFDKLKLQDVSKEDIGEINREGSDLIIKFVEGGGENAESIRIKSWFASSEVVDSNQQVVGGKNYKIEEIEFSDGSKWGVTDIEQLYKYKITGTDNADKLGGKNDHGMIIEGKKGDDVITGGTKEDIYIVNSGDENDVIKTTGGGEDTIKVNASSDSLSFKAMNMNDMVMFLHDVNGSASLTLTGYFDQQKHETQKIKQVEALSDSAILTEKNLQLLIQAMASFETEKGITWEKAVEQKDPQTKEILSQYWSYEKKE